MEVEVASENLVTALTAEDHFNAHSFDFAAEEIHGSTRSHGRHIVCLEVVYDVRDSVQTFLHREGKFMVDSSKEVCCFFSGYEIGGVS
jgi:hypothetical protein